MHPNPRSIIAKVRERARQALRGNASELVRLLNFRAPTWGHSACLVEEHRSAGSLPDEWVDEWVIWLSVTAMREIAEALVAARGDKRSLGIRNTFCECLGRLLSSRSVFLGGYPVMLWSQDQRERIAEQSRLLAPRLLVALWDADPRTLRRLRQCRYPECPRPWFADSSRGRPRRYCCQSHRTRTSERLSPAKKTVLRLIPKGRWVSLHVLEVTAGAVPHPYLSMALTALCSEGRLKRRSVAADSRGHREITVNGEVIVGLIAQYRQT
jgi:hypothetical protein